MWCLDVFGDQESWVKVEGAEDDVGERAQAEREFGQRVDSYREYGDFVDDGRCAGGLSKVFGDLTNEQGAQRG